MKIREALIALVRSAEWVLSEGKDGPRRCLAFRNCRNAIAEAHAALKPVDCKNPVHEHKGKWWFWNEIWGERIGPYTAQALADEACRKYAKEL